MCGRYALWLTDQVSKLALYFDLDAVDRRFPPEDANWRPRYNVAPSQLAPVIVLDPDGKVTLTQKRWGLVPPWSAKSGRAASGLINARSETVREKPSFRQAIEKRRCLVPTYGFYEWDRARKPHWIHAGSVESPELLLFGGLYEGDTFAILTEESSEGTAMRAIHERRPVLFRKQDLTIAEWLDPKNRNPKLSGSGLEIGSGLSDRLLTKRVNRPAHDDSSVLDEAPVTVASDGSAQRTLF